MRPNKMRELLKSNKPTLSTHIHTTWPSVVEPIGHTGLYDYVEFVGEYGPFDLYDLDNLARAADIYNMSMQLKVDQEPRGFLAQRAIGPGFHSILSADCRSAAHGQECVRIVRPAIRRTPYSTWASGTSPLAPTSRSCTSGGSLRVRTSARRSATDLRR